MTGAENAGDDAVPAPLLRPAPIDAELLVAVHRGLEAVPASAPHAAPAERGDVPHARPTARRRG